MQVEELFPVRAMWSRRAEKQELKRIAQFAVKALIKFLGDKTGCSYRLLLQPEAAPDWELRNISTGAVIGIELTDDFSWDEQQTLTKAWPDIQSRGFADIKVQDPRNSFYKLIKKKYAKHQLVSYPAGNRILMVGLRRVGAAVLTVDVLGIDGLKESFTYMDQFPEIDHIFAWWLTAEGVGFEHVWSRTAFP